MRGVPRRRVPDVSLHDIAKQGVQWLHGVPCWNNDNDICLHCISGHSVWRHRLPCQLHWHQPENRGLHMPSERSERRLLRYDCGFIGPLQCLYHLRCKHQGGQHSMHRHDEYRMRRHRLPSKLSRHQCRCWRLCLPPRLQWHHHNSHRHMLCMCGRIHLFGWIQ